MNLIFDTVFDVLKNNGNINDIKNGSTYLHKIILSGYSINVDSIFDFFDMLNFDFNLVDKNNLSILYLCLIFGIKIPSYILDKMEICENSILFILENKLNHPIKKNLLKNI